MINVMREATMTDVTSRCSTPLKVAVSGSRVESKISRIMATHVSMLSDNIIAFNNMTDEEEVDQFIRANDLLHR